MKTSASQNEKKPNVVVFTALGMPKPTQKRERPKGVPRFKPLSKTEKLKIVQGVHGLPRVANVTPFLILTVDNMLVTGPANNPLGYLTLNFPDQVFFPLAHYASSQLNSPSGECSRAFINLEDVEVTFRVDAGVVYMVDFWVAVDTVPVDFQLTLGNVPSSPQRANVGGNHLFTPPVYVNPASPHVPPGPFWYKATLRLAPVTDHPPYPQWGPWYFIAAEISKFVNAP